MDKNRKWIFIAAGIILLVLAIVLIRGLWNPNAEEKKKGIEYLKKLEARDMESVESDIKKVRKEAQAEAMESGELSVWAQFSDIVIFGDSRSVGFSFYEFLDNQRVMAEPGNTLKDLTTYLEQIKTLNPSCVILSTGVNDVSIGLWPTAEEYIAAYDETMNMLMEELPDTHIYVNSIFPAQDPAFNKLPALSNIPEYNAAVKNWCEEKGYSYIDNEQVYEEHKDLYEEDGIHFRREFYEYWAINMITEVNT